MAHRYGGPEGPTVTLNGSHFSTGMVNGIPPLANGIPPLQKQLRTVTNSTGLRFNGVKLPITFSYSRDCHRYDLNGVDLNGYLS